MLIGLAAKNAILIVFFANRNTKKAIHIRSRTSWRTYPAAAHSDDFVCFHPWLYATLVRSGSGGVSRQTLGTVVIGGMLGATLVDIFIVPVPL